MMRIVDSVYNSMKGIRDELVHKVSWPSQRELYSSTVVVVVASLVMSVVIFIIDFSFENLVTFFYKNIFK